jgi:hypothetical protein
LSLLPTFATLTDANDDIETVVTGIQALPMALRPVANYGKGVIFEVVLQLGQWPITPLINDLLGPGKIQGPDPAYSLS